MSILWVGIIGLFFIALGALILSLSTAATEVRIRYDDVCGTQRFCQVEFTLDQEMAGPIYFYYNIQNFYQNYRLLFDSKSLSQLLGSDLAADGVAACQPIVLNQNLDTQQSIGNNFLDPNAVAFPCGGLAKAFFNGSLRLMRQL